MYMAKKCTPNIKLKVHRIKYEWEANGAVDRGGFKAETLLSHITRKASSPSVLLPLLPSPSLPSHPLPSSLPLP